MAETGAGLFESASVPDGYRRYLQPVVFEPWAERLLDYVGVAPGQVVLDVASGTGVVARAAARRVGGSGRVIATDISPMMLAQVVAGSVAGQAAGLAVGLAEGLAEDVAPVQTRVCAATELDVPDASVDVVLCQQGFPFIPDRAAAAREMCRVLRAGGRVGVAVWLSGKRLEPFETYAEVLAEEGLAAPFPHAYDISGLTMSVREVEQALISGGFGDVAVAPRDLEVRWPEAEAATLGITGTPYGPPLAALDNDRRRGIVAALRRRLTTADGTPPRHVTTAVLGRGTAGHDR